MSLAQLAQHNPLSNLQSRAGYWGHRLLHADCDLLTSTAKAFPGENDRQWKAPMPFWLKFCSKGPFPSAHPNDFPTHPMRIPLIVKPWLNHLWSILVVYSIHPISITQIYVIVNSVDLFLWLSHHFLWYKFLKPLFLWCLPSSIDDFPR